MSLTLKSDYQLHVWAPDMVYQSGLRYSLDTALLQFNNDSYIERGNTATGTLCCNSTENAPFFSRWKKCGTADKGPEQDYSSTVLPIH